MPMNPRLLRPRASGFDPRSIPGLQLWLDAADLSTITTGTGVSEWRDKSSTGSKWVQAVGNEQPATGTQTMNGRNVIAFDGSNDSLSAVTPLSTSMPLSLVIVQRVVASTFFGMTYTSGTTTGHFNIRQDANTGGFSIVADNAGTVYVEATSQVGVSNIVSWIVPAASNSTLFRNGSSLALSNGSLKPVLTGTHYLGRRSDGFYLNGWIAEVIAYSTELSAQQRQRTEGYLAWKWGLQSQLPYDHPYVNGFPGLRRYAA